MPEYTRFSGHGGETKNTGEGASALWFATPSERTLLAYLGTIFVKPSQTSVSWREEDDITLQKVSTMPTGFASYLPETPTTLLEAKTTIE